MPRIFISYKRNAPLDDPLAQRLHTRLGHIADVFIDTTMLVGEDWVARIEEEVRQSDFLVLLLSEHSITSPMVAEEIRMADAAFKQAGKPRLLPVRVGYEGRLPYDLGGVLGRLNYALWNSEADDDALFISLQRAVNGVELPTPFLKGGSLGAEVPLPAADPRRHLEPPEGAMDAESRFYVERDADFLLNDEQQQSSYTLTIQAPRQMGKSSMLGRVMARARERGKRVAFVDFQSFGSEGLRDDKLLYRQFSLLIEDALDLDPKLDAFWRDELSAVQNCRRFMERRILPECDSQGLLLALDEADSLLEADTRTDFFGMLRSWHSERANKPVWKRFALAMVISTEPALLIDNVAQSPFNVGTVVRLEDFDATQTAAINVNHGAPLDGQQVTHLHELLGGHPYLTRRALYVLAKGRWDFARLIAEAPSESGPFGDHLRALLTRLIVRSGLKSELHAALQGDRVADAPRHRLIAGGLIREEGGRLVARNNLYKSYFERALRG